ncbi:hypothetical protein BCR36DRAFT_280888, partial [Piromyces finnis]
FKNIYGDVDYPSSFLNSNTYGSKITFKNSTIEDSYVKLYKPFFSLSLTKLELIDSNLKNCYSQYGYLIFLKSIKEKNKEFLKIKNTKFNGISSLLYGYNNIASISNSQFYNISSRVPYPVILNSIHSSISIKDTIFKNIKSQKSGLIGEEAEYIFENVAFENIETISKSLLYVIYNSITLNHCTFSNILCNGSINDSSLITVESSIYGNNINIKNTIINKCKSNGDLIKLRGEMSNIKFLNISISENTSYGSILNNESLNSEFSITNSSIKNNDNIHSYKCGIFSNYNRVNITIKDTEFKNNSNKSNGGSLCIIESDSLNLKIESSIFENNYAVNGGAIYLSSNNNNNRIEIRDIQVKNNKATYFGGGIFFDYINLNNTFFNNVKINNNKAYAGGGMYINNTISNLPLNFENYDKDEQISFENNLSESHGNNYATNPYIIKLNSEKSNHFEIIGGESINIEFSLYDKFIQEVIDLSKLYSNINLNVSLNDDDNEYKVIGNVCTFLKGKF